MIKLVFITCLAAAPAECRERSIPIYEQISPMACLMGAPATLAQWRATHPSWRIGRWRCEPERRNVAAAME